MGQESGGFSSRKAIGSSGLSPVGGTAFTHRLLPLLFLSFVVVSATSASAALAPIEEVSVARITGADEVCDANSLVLQKAGVPKWEDYGVYAYIFHFAGGADPDADGYYETFTFTLGVVAADAPGPGSAYVKAICKNTGQVWWSSSPWSLPQHLGGSRDFRQFSEADFAGHLNGNTDLDFTVELWDLAKTTMLATTPTATYGPVKADPKSTTVPNVVGQTQVVAGSLLTGANLVVGTLIQQCSDNVAAGLIIRQTPTAYQQVISGSAVTMVVSAGACAGQAEGEGGMEGEDSGAPAALAQVLYNGFSEYDTDGDGKLGLGDAQAAAPQLTPMDFNSIDTDQDGFISREDLQSYLGISDSGCRCNKSESALNELKNHLGDFFLGSLSLLALLSYAKRQR